MIATIRGLLLATGDGDRVQDAAESFFSALEKPVLPAAPGR